METAAAILTKIIFDNRDDLRNKLKGLNVTDPRTPAQFVAQYYDACLDAVTPPSTRRRRH